MISILNHINQKDLDKLSKWHYKETLNPSRSEHIILDELNAIVNNVNFTPIQRTITSYIINNYESIITSKPKELENYINEFENRGYDQIIDDNDRYRDALLNAFAYKKYRGWVSAAKLAQELDLKACPYCNAQYTLVTKQKSSNKLAFQLDHFYPKSIYPYLSMSFYNLIPSCGVCNNAKANTKTNITESYHPYSNESVSDDFSFCTDALDVVEAYVKGKTRFSINIVDEENLADKTKRHLKDYSIKKLYKRHDDVVEEIVWKKLVYTEKYRDQLWQAYNARLFMNKYDLDRFIIGNYVRKEDVLRRPLSKFATDIARDIGLIK